MSGRSGEALFRKAHPIYMKTFRLHQLVKNGSSHASCVSFQSSETGSNNMEVVRQHEDKHEMCVTVEVYYCTYFTTKIH